VTAPPGRRPRRTRRPSARPWRRRAGESRARSAGTTNGRRAGSSAASGSPTSSRPRACAGGHRPARRPVPNLTAWADCARASRRRSGRRVSAARLPRRRPTQCRRRQRGQPMDGDGEPIGALLVAEAQPGPTARVGGASRIHPRDGQRERQPTTRSRRADVRQPQMPVGQQTWGSSS